MNIAFETLRALSMVTFLWYGSACVFADSMVVEFERFGLARLRTLVGGLELLGAVGLLVGYLVPAIVIPAAGGLCLLMGLGVATRIRVGDPFVEWLPAAILGLINAFVLVGAIAALRSR